MLDSIDITNVLFLDIECVSGKAQYEELPDTLQELWWEKAKYLAKPADGELAEEEIAELYTQRAAIYAEFGKIICISVGFVVRDKDQVLRLRLKSFASPVEGALLDDFCDLLLKYYNNPDKYYLCGHNIKEFDIPYICRRLLVNQIALPPALDLYGKKPWETKHLLDTMELWKFGDKKSYTSLKLLAAILDFPSPKDDISGADVGRVFWEENDLPRIAHYCEKDVLATVQLFLRLRRMPLLVEDQVIHVG